MKNTSPKVIEAILKYQVLGCVSDFDPTNFKQDGVGVEWSEHTPGTILFPGGTVFLGMPKGFNKATLHYVGMEKDLSHPCTRINIFEDHEQQNRLFKYDAFNVPVWKHLNDKGHTFVRGLCPRTNRVFLHIILEDCLDKIDCLTITKEMQAEMD